MSMSPQADLLPGTLDLLILKAVSLGAHHGYGVLLRIEQITGGALAVEQGALYPALYRLEHQGLLGLLKRLNQTVEQNAIEAPVRQTNAMVVMLGEGVHGGLQVVR